MLALYQVFKRSPGLGRNTSKTTRESDALICTRGSVGGLRGKAWTQAGHRTLKHAVVSLFVDHLGDICCCSSKVQLSAL